MEDASDRLTSEAADRPSFTTFQGSLDDEWSESKETRSPYLLQKEAAESQCNLYSYNNSDPFHLPNPYGGIPTNLLTNLIAWILLMLLFIIIRKSAYKYVKVKRLGHLVIAEQQNLVARVTHLLFSGQSSPGPEEDIQRNLVQSEGSLIPRTVDNPNYEDDSADRIHFDRTSMDEKADETLEEVREESDSSSIVSHDEAAINSQNIPQDDEEGFWSWFVKVFTLTDDQIKMLAGNDAVQYLRFERFIIGYVIITTILSVCVILPFNFQGKQEGNMTDFGHTTLRNLDPESPFLWAHIVIAFFLFLAAIFIMRKFSVQLKFQDSGLEITRTLAIENIPKHLCQDEILRKYYSEAYPHMELHDLKFAYDVCELDQLEKQLKDARSCLHYAEQYRNENEDDISMYPYIGARCCCCLYYPCSKPVSVMEYYTAKADDLELELRKQRQISITTPLGIAFVTFKSLNDAKEVYYNHNRTSIFSCRPVLPFTSFCSSLNTKKWKVWFAPPPRDIYWQNLSDTRRWLLLKTIVSNVLLFVVAFFLTTPEFIVSKLDYFLIIIGILKVDDNSQDIPAYSWIQDFLPTILLWSFTALLPLLVAYSDRWLGRWTRSEENHSVMRKTFWYLLFMVIVFPTFGFTTGYAFFSRVFNPSNNETQTFRWECVFLPDSGAFFVNYVITAALIGTGLELIRFPDLFWYAMQICLSKTKAETPAIQRGLTYEFRFGEEYARMLMIFSMVMMYSLSCPLITPFGLLYFVLKHLVDRHNLSFVYAPSKINKKVHASAIHFVIMSVGLLQLFMVVFALIRNGSLSEISLITKVALILFFITINIFTAQIWSDFCKRLSPIKYEDKLLLDDEADDEHNQEYLPPVLKGVFDDHQVTREDEDWYPILLLSVD